MPNNTQKPIKEYLLLLLIILLVIAIGMFAVNQSLAYYYKSQFLQSPCSLCLTLNERLEPCFKEQLTIYKDNKGNEITKEEYRSGLINQYNLSNINLTEVFQVD